MGRAVNHPKNCVGVITVRWSVINGNVKTVCSQAFGFNCGYPTKREAKELKEDIQNKLQQLVEKDKAHFDINDNSVVRFSSSIKLLGCDMFLKEENKETPCRK